MKKSAFTEEQIAYALRQVELGTPVAEVCRKLGVSEQTFYRWKRKFASMGIAELRRLRQLEEEHRKLKQLVADLTLDKHRLQEVIRKTPESRPSAGNWCSLGGSAFKSASDGRAMRSRCIARPSGTGVSLGTRLPCGCGCGTWLAPGGGMAIAGSRCCSGGKAGQ
jgi:putative transposase